MLVEDPEFLLKHGKWLFYLGGPEVIGHISQVVSITGRPADNRFTVQPRVRLQYPSELNPYVKIISPVVEAGLENMTLVTLHPAGAQTSVEVRGALNCWIANCEITRSRHSLICVAESKNISVTGCFLHDGWRFDGEHGLWGYGLRLTDGTSDCLVSDNVFSKLRHAMVVQRGANGNVFSMNYSINHNPQENRAGSADFSAHGGVPYMNLVESNVLQYIQSSDNFGCAGPLQTFFRNRVCGEGILIALKSHFPVVIGNMLDGGLVYMEPRTLGGVFSANKTSAIGAPMLIFQNARYAPVPCGDEVDDNADIPASLYLSEKPNFLGRTAWPCFGPDVVVEAVLPAQRRYETQYIAWGPLER